MTQGNANILDMLLGPVTPQSATGQSQQIGSVPGDGPVFGDLLSIFLGGSSNAAVQGELNAAGTGQPFSDFISAQNTNDGNPAGTSDRAGKTSVNRTLGAPLVVKPEMAVSPIVADSPATLVPETDFPSSRDTEATAANLEAPKFDGPWLSAAASRFVQSLMQSGINDVSQSVPLSDGRYQIVAAKVTDNTARLTLRSSQNPSQTVQLSLPAEMLDDLAVPVSSKSAADGESVTQRINILDYNPSTFRSGDTGPIIDHLFAKLQLKELKVESFTDDHVELTQEPDIDARNKAMVQLTARRAGQEIVAQRIIPREQLMIRTPQSPVTDEADDGISFKHLLDSASPVQKGVPGNKYHALSGESAKTVNWFRPLELKDNARMQDEDGDITQKVLLGGNQSGSTETASGTNSRQGVQITRFVLPDNLAHSLKPNGQSVRIAIEPDNLGPARLHLVMRDTGLTARVTVDTMAAKNMIENSLSQLARQLHDAGVKVDAIQVNVAGGQADPRNFEQNFTQYHHVRMSRYHNDDSTLEVPAAGVAVATAVRAEYAGPDGVNIYA